MKPDSKLIEKLIGSLDRSTCNFCAVEEIRRRLEEKGYRQLLPGDEWNIAKGDRFYVTKNGSAIFAFNVGTAMDAAAGFRVVAAHSDSPCFKLKPHPEIRGEHGVVSLNVEKYGGGIMYTWFDRPLSISGRVMLKGETPLSPKEVMIDFRRPVAVIPHLAIHFNRGVNEGNALSVQRDMKPVMGFAADDSILRESEPVKAMVAGELKVAKEDILSMELSLYPVEKPTLVGAHDEMIMSGRIDDLSMAFTGLEAFLNSEEEMAETPYTRVLAIFDNEETGSGTKQGAHSPVLKTILERICGAFGSDRDLFARNVAKSFLISADDAHAFHPNYPGEYDPVNHPYFGGGLAVKINANCKYMTDAHSEAVFAGLCHEAGVPFQHFVNHGDKAGGSTLGNILTAQLEMAGVDVGCPIWAMHSACETAGTLDHIYAEMAFRQLYLQQGELL